MSLSEVKSKSTDVLKSNNKNNIDINKRADSSQIGKSVSEKKVNIDKRVNNVENMRKLGGSYKEVKKYSDGAHEVHHMPADCISPLNREDGPCIMMKTKDHRMTASCGNSKEAREYRDKQKDLISQGKFNEAAKMDIDDIHSKFGRQYDPGISQMKDYLKSLQSGGKI